MDGIIEIEGLRKCYGELVVVDGLSLVIGEGEIFGLLGPNGAGKTTTLSILEGLKTADGGRVCLFGLDVETHGRAIRQRIGVQLQATSLLPDLTVREQVLLFGRLYGMRPTAERVHALLERVGLTAKGDALPDKLSGGQKQRLALALALVNDPEIVFLDEPTAGLDPQSRRMVWEIVQSFKKEGRTVVLTTHYMEEAEFLADRVGILDQGRLLALDTPAGLIGWLPEENGRRDLEEVFLWLTGKGINCEL